MSLLASRTRSTHKLWVRPPRAGRRCRRGWVPTVGLASACRESALLRALLARSVRFRFRQNTSFQGFRHEEEHDGGPDEAHTAAANRGERQSSDPGENADGE